MRRADDGRGGFTAERPEWASHLMCKSPLPRRGAGHMTASDLVPTIAVRNSLHAEIDDMRAGRGRQVDRRQSGHWG
jgi:hypothetical protein